MTTSDDTPAKKPPRETAKALRAYADYEAMGDDRSYEKLAAQYGKPSGYSRQLERWAAAFDWQGRLRTYEEKRLVKRRRKRESAIDKMDKRHAQLGQEQAEKAIAQIEALITAKKFGSQAAVQLLKFATDLERLARGAATERLEASGPDGTPLQVGFYPVMLPQKNEDGEGDE